MSSREKKCGPIKYNDTSSMDIIQIKMGVRVNMYGKELFHVGTWHGLYHTLKEYFQIVPSNLILIIVQILYSISRPNNTLFYENHEY